jgi:YVTN family beta-propeller protein
LAVFADTKLGTELAGYRVEQLLGRGGMSVVYRAEHVRLRRKAALKLLAPELAEDERFRERFLRESQLAASIEHPHIVPVYDAGEVDGLLYIAMRYVEGVDLKTLLRREGPLQPQRALELVAQVAEALDAAHAHGLVHRDVKPSNVLVGAQAGKEHCYLADFGLTKSSSDPGGLTDSGQIVGTIDYVAPEQIQAGVVDGRADVYSLTCLLYECLTSEVPFKRPNEIAVIYAHLEDSPPRASEDRPELPAELDLVFAKGMAKLPDDRYRSAGQLIEAARGSLPGETVSTPAPFERRRRRPLLVAAAAALVAGAVALGVLLSRGGGIPLSQAGVVRIDAAGLKVSATARLGGVPTAVVVCAGSVWVTSLDGTVSEIDPRSSAVDRIRVQGAPWDVADVGNLAAVVTKPPRNTVTMIDAQFGRISNVVSLPGPPRLAASATAYGPTVWIADPNTHALERLEAPYTHLAGSTALPGSGRFASVAVGAGAIWIVGGRTLWQVDPATHRLAATIDLGFAPADVAAGAGGVWVVDARSDAVVRVDPTSARIVARIRVGRSPRAVAFGSGAVWVANEADGAVSRIDPGRNAVTRTIAVGADPVDLAAGLGAIWVVRHPK